MSKRLRVRLTNNFHLTSVIFTMTSVLGRGPQFDPLYTFSSRTLRRVRATLCGSKDCKCGDVFGARGRQPIRLVCTSETGALYVTFND